MALCSFHLLHYEHHIGSCAQDRHQVSSDQVARWKVELGKHHQFPCPVVKSGAMRSRWDSDKLQQDRYMSVRWDPSQSQKASKLIRRHIQLCRGIITEGNNHRRKSTQGSVGGPRVAIVWQFTSVARVHLYGTPAQKHKDSILSICRLFYVLNTQQWLRNSPCE